MLRLAGCGLLAGLRFRRRKLRSRIQRLVECLHQELENLAALRGIGFGAERLRLEVNELEIGLRDLQGEEEQTGEALIHAALNDRGLHVLNRNLDGVGIFEERKLKASS